MEPSGIEEALADCELFKGLERGEIQSIAGICRVAAYEKGQLIYQQGDFGEQLYIIADGQVVLERTMNIGPREGRVVIATLGKGRVFGCWSTLLNEPHIMMLKTYCQMPTTILVLKGAELRALMTRDTRFGFNVMEKLCLLLRERIQAAYGAMEKI
ncbi:MAG: cyclic nucleotide-binding domain-containing protein [Desulfobacterales bacterium]|nr:MAG: cyclic nucleotide-binding domain-containing protein [Desulfobacterales bacterium]